MKSKPRKRYNKDLPNGHIFIDQLDPQKTFFTDHLELGLRPRHYADQIIAKKSRADRRELLAKVPEHYRDLVETHVKIAFDRLANPRP